MLICLGEDSTVQLKRLLIIVPSALIVLAIAILLLLSVTPAVQLDPAVTMVGSETPLKIHLDAKHGIRRLTVYIDQNGQRYTAAGMTRPAANGADILLLVGSKTTPALKDGKAVLTIEAVSNDFRRSTGSLTRDITIATQPPLVSADGEQHYINQGGSEVVMISPSGYWTAAGVKVGKYTFRSFAMPGGKAGRFSLYAFPWDVPEDTVPEVFASNPAGAEATAHFAYKLFPKPFRKRDLTIDDRFMERVLSDIEPGATGDLLTRFLDVNRNMRKRNNQTLSDLRLKTEERFLWNQPFEQQPNSKVESVFADHRSYIYNGKKVDEEVHLGFDLSVTKHVPVQASNDGKVIYASRLGIYGNCVVIDHGYGLQSIYGHLSVIGVKVGDMVKRRQIIGHSGSTGLAGGDHLHFSMQLDGVEVNPVEWWDGHWIKDHVRKRLGLTDLR